MIRNLALFLAVVFWLSVAFWVYKDARRRSRDPLFIALAIALGLVPPFLGTLVYLLFRPPEYLADVRERELELRAIAERLSRAEPRCPVCRGEVQPSFLVCPVCATRLRQPCGSCNAPLAASWQICPYCETSRASIEGDLLEAVSEAVPREPRKRRRRSSEVA